jgi:hypothetical protein
MAIAAYRVNVCHLYVNETNGRPARGARSSGRA